MNGLLLRAGYTVAHPRFVALQLPAQAVLVELHASGLAELSNGLWLPQQELLRVETGEQ